MTAIKLWLTDELLRKLTEEAEATGIDRQTLINQVLARHIMQTGQLPEPRPA